MLFVVQRHERLTDSGMAAVELKPLVRRVVLYLPGVAGYAAGMALRQSVDCLAEGRVILEQIDILTFRVQDVGRHAGEDIKICHQLEQLLLVKKYIHSVSPPCAFSSV